MYDLPLILERLLRMLMDEIIKALKYGPEWPPRRPRGWI
jgi:hypothetical protein